MRTTKLGRYVLSKIDVLGTDEEKVLAIVVEMLQETKYDNRKLRLAEKMTEWLMGLPNSINLPFYNCDVIKAAKEELGIRNSDDKILREWFPKIASAIICSYLRLLKGSLCIAIIDKKYDGQYPGHDKVAMVLDVVTSGGDIKYAMELFREDDTAGRITFYYWNGGVSDNWEVKEIEK